MSVAPVNCVVLQLTEEKGILEEQRMFIDGRREILSLKTSELATERSAQLVKMMNDENSDEVEEATGSQNETPEFNYEEFEAEYQAQIKKLDAQDKALEMQRTNLNSRLDGITTLLESTEKRLNKNIESEFKGASGS